MASVRRLFSASHSPSQRREEDFLSGAPGGGRIPAEDLSDHVGTLEPRVSQGQAKGEPGANQVLAGLWIHQLKQRHLLAEGGTDSGKAGPDARFSQPSYPVWVWSWNLAFTLHFSLSLSLPTYLFILLSFFILTQRHDY